jgi:hypothetical protein
MARMKSAKAADKEALQIVKKANTGNITPRLREDGLHDFIVNGIRCDVCGGELFADGIGVRGYDGTIAVDGVMWWCTKCGEVDREGKPDLLSYKKAIVERHKTGNVLVDWFEAGMFSFYQKAPCLTCGRRVAIDPASITEENPDGEPVMCECQRQAIIHEALDALKKQYGDNPANWPRPDYQTLPWNEWVQAYEAEAKKAGLPQDLSAVLVDWFEGRTPENCFIPF